MTWCAWGRLFGCVLVAGVAGAAEPTDKPPSSPRETQPKATGPAGLGKKLVDSLGGRGSSGAADSGAAESGRPTEGRPPEPPAQPPVLPGADSDAGKTSPGSPPVIPQPGQPSLPFSGGRIPAKQPHEPKGLEGVGLTAEQVNRAIDHGADYLWKFVKAERAKVGTQFGGYREYDLLVGLALVKAKAHKRHPDFDQQLRAYLPKVRVDEIGVYGNGVLCMLLEAFGDPEFQSQLNLSARYLFEGQSADGSWQYYPKVAPEALRDPKSLRALQVWGGRPPDGSPVEQWRRLTEPNKHEGGDNSVTQYALLGLQAATRAGVEVPADVWKRVLDLYKARQNLIGSWGYIGQGSASTGSMTCAGLYATALSRFQLGQAPHSEDESIERALAWLAHYFTVAENPGAGMAYQYYYIYSLERAGRTLDTEFIGEHEWYPLGAKYLLGAQKENGGWIEPGAYESRPDIATSFALLFLTRGTTSLTKARPTGGKGTLKTATVEPAAPRVYLIFDCSGSMLVEIAGRSKFAVAREALNDIVRNLPAQTQLALRVYGHRKSARDPGADEDTELLVPMGPMQPADMTSRVQRLRARGKTPLARSIAEAAKDLTGSAAGAIAESRCAVILITDGGEHTRPPGDPVAAAQDLARVPGVTLHVVGFDIGRDDWGRQLRAIARSGGGRYWSAGDAAALRGELRAAVLRTPETFAVTDSQGRRIHQGPFGQAVALAEGHYTLTTTFAGKEFAEPLWINTGVTTAVLFDAGKIDVTPGAGAPVGTAGGAGTASTGGEPGAANGKTCADCGGAVAAGAKFCTNCGKRVGG